MHRPSRLLLIAALAFAISLAGGPQGDGDLRSVTLAANSCPSTTTPAGALPPNIPIWCQAPLAELPSSYVEGANSWVDDFANATATPTHIDGTASRDTGYTVFESAGPQIGLTQHWRQNGHWMVDVQGGENFGGTMMRPDRSFKFVNGKLVVEGQVAAGMTAYGPQVNAWPEIDISLADHPTGIKDNLYGYGVFKGNWALGCRFEPIREPICAMEDNTDRGEFDGGRIFEISFFQSAGGSIFGGFPSGDLANAWRMCDGTDPDLNCRDTFRWELTKNQLSVYVNNTLYMQHNLDAAHELPDAIVNGNVYVYFSDWIYKPGVDTVRFHWKHLSVNAASFAGNPPPPSPVPTVAASPAPSQSAPPAPSPSAPAPSAQASPAPNPSTVPSPRAGSSPSATQPSPGAVALAPDSSPNPTAGLPDSATTTQPGALASTRKAPIGFSRRLALSARAAVTNPFTGLFALLALLIGLCASWLWWARRRPRGSDTPG